jgi:hypothetical protein
MREAGQIEVFRFYLDEVRKTGEEVEVSSRDIHVDMSW